MTEKREVRDDQHGTSTGYEYGCRCRQCRAARRARSRLAKSLPVKSHGLGGYKRGCRCEECVDVQYAGQGASRQKDWAEGTASGDEVREFGKSFGLTVPYKLPQGLIDRWNRTHPDRPYVGKKPS